MTVQSWSLGAVCWRLVIGACSFVDLHVFGCQVFF